MLSKHRSKERIQSTQCHCSNDVYLHFYHSPPLYFPIPIMYSLRHTLNILCGKITE
jgi:hypothetical protein